MNFQIMARYLFLPVFTMMFTVLLYGQRNETTIVQIDPHSYYHLVQDGTLNKIYIEQAGGHYATVSQTSDFNEASITQLSGSGLTGTRFPPGKSNPPPFSSNLSHSTFASIVQTGDFNMAEITQTGSHHAEIKQVGNKNSADIEQNGSGGNSDKSGIPFHPPGNPDVCPPPFAPCRGDISTDGLLAFILQEGSDNAASISQNGHSQVAVIHQNGNGNQAVITQRGNQNTASTEAGSSVPGNGIAKGKPKR
ncbi:MAG: hypothetical protein EA359_02525 [Balneolaceae bacterium]|nr:MAG: hypothetical protein EA359_02525 [Balneolaceae bacterium]